MNGIIEKLNEINELIEKLTNEQNELKLNLIEELKNTEEKNYRTDKALYSLKVISNDKFNEDKLKEEHEEVYNNYLKTKVSFDITTFKKKEKELVEKYTEAGEPTFSLMIKENKIEEEIKKEIQEVEL